MTIVVSLFHISLALGVALTDNSLNDLSPQISGSNVVWNEFDGNDWEIYFYNGSTITQLTNNNYNDFEPQVDGNNIVWYGHDGNDYEIFQYDGLTINQLTDNSYDDTYPQVDGNNVVWQSQGEIFLYNGSSTANVSNKPLNDFYPQVDGNNIVWQGHDGSDWEIYLFDGLTVTNISNNSYDDNKPLVSGNNVTWEAWTGSDYEIFLYNGSVSNISNKNGSDHVPQISGNNIVWRGYDGNDYEIFLYNGSGVTQITNNSVDDNNPQVEGNNIVWDGSDGNDYEIFLHDGTTVTQLTNNISDDVLPKISSGNVVFVNSYGDTDIHLLMPKRQVTPSQAWNSGSGNWSFDASKPVVGDFNGDGIDDLAIAYAYFNEREVKIWVFLGNGDGGFNSPTLWWASGPNNWDWKGSKLTAGDFNNDGSDDIAILYGYFAQREVKAWFFPSTGSSFNSPSAWWSSGPNNWDWKGSRIGSVYGSTYIFYGYGGAQSALFELPSPISSFNGPISLWNSGPGNWASAATKVAFDYYYNPRPAPFESSMIMLYGYKTERDVKIFVLYAPTMSTIELWSAGPDNWDWEGSQFISGDFDGNYYSNPIIPYSYAGARTKIFAFPRNQDGLSNPISLWDSGPGNWEGNATKFLSGDFDGDGFDEFLGIYNYGGAHTALFIFN